MLVVRDGKEVVLKLSNKPEHNDRLRAEAEVLKKLRHFLTVLHKRNGMILKSALAQKLEQPELYIDSILVAMRRILNVDGYGVLSVDETSGTVMLDRELLEVQFELK